MITILKLTAVIGLSSLMSYGLILLISALGLAGPGTFFLLIILWVLCPVLFHD